MPAIPQQTYYPSCVVNLTIRFDESFIDGPGIPKPMSTTDAATNPAVLPARGSGKALALEKVPSGDAARRFTESRNVHTINRIPAKCSVSKSGVRSASTFELTLPFRDLPLDPRVIRAIGVEIHMGTVSAEDFARGVRGMRRADGSLYSTVATRNAEGRLNASTLVMVGIVDEISEEIGGEGGVVVHMSGRDQRGMLLNSPLKPTLINELDYNRPIHELVEEILNRHPMSQRVRIGINPQEWPGGRIPEALPGDILPPHRRGSPRRGGGRARAAAHPPGGGGGHGHEMSYWDLITRLCMLVGAVPTFVNDVLWIRPLRGLFSQNRATPDGRYGTPFNPDQPRVVDGSEPIRIRRMAVGNNLARLSFKRTLVGEKKVKAVRVVSVDLRSENRAENHTIEAIWPPQERVQRTRVTTRTSRTGRETTSERPRDDGDQDASENGASAAGSRETTTAAPSGQGGQQDVATIPVYGITDKNRLTEIARGLYEEMARGEMTGTFDTNNLASFGGGNSDPDMLRAEPGDAVEIVVEAGAIREAGTGVVSSVTDHYTAPYEEQVRKLTALLGNELFARALLTTSRGRINQLQRVFRLSSLSLEWSNTDGISVSGELQNYYVVRSEVDASPPVTAAPTMVTTKERP